MSQIDQFLESIRYFLPPEAFQIANFFLSVAHKNRAEERGGRLVRFQGTASERSEPLSRANLYLHVIQ